MKPRSIVLDLCGDYVRYHNNTISLTAISDILALFNVNADNVRVLMSRLRREGFFETTRNGRSTSYVITPATLRTLDDGRARIFTHNSDQWAGEWHLVIYQVPESQRSSREALRTGLAWLGYGTLAPSTWISAHDKRTMVDELFSKTQHARVDQLIAHSRGVAEDRHLAARCWDLEQLAANYRHWIEVWQAKTGLTVSDRQAFILRTHLVHDYRKFPFADPDLPRELLPDQWPGFAAHDLFLALYEAWAAPAERHYQSATTAAAAAAAT